MMLIYYNFTRQNNSFSKKWPPYFQATHFVMKKWPWERITSPECDKLVDFLLPQCIWNLSFGRTRKGLVRERYYCRYIMYITVLFSLSRVNPFPLTVMYNIWTPDTYFYTWWSKNSKWLSGIFMYSYCVYILKSS